MSRVGRNPIELPSEVKVTIEEDQVRVQGPRGTLTTDLKYQSHKDPIIRCLKRVSKPGRRVYTRKGDIPVVLGGLGINILSTSKGVLTGKKAKQEGVGGEILCEVY